MLPQGIHFDPQFLQFGFFFPQRFFLFRSERFQSFSGSQLIPQFFDHLFHSVENGSIRQSRLVVALDHVVVENRGIFEAKEITNEIAFPHLQSVEIIHAKYLIDEHLKARNSLAEKMRLEIVPDPSFGRKRELKVREITLQLLEQLGKIRISPENVPIRRTSVRIHSPSSDVIDAELENHVLFVGLNDFVADYFNLDAIQFLEMSFFGLLLIIFIERRKEEEEEFDEVYLGQKTPRRKCRFGI